MNREELRQLTEDVVASDIYNKLSSLGGDFSVKVDASMKPEIVINTGDDTCRIKVNTRAIVRRSDGVVGWEFVPTVINAGISEKVDLDTMGEVRDRFKRWAAIADVAEKLFEREFYPGDYEE